MSARRECGCLAAATVIDAARHTAWHAETAAQHGADVDELRARAGVAATAVLEREGPRRAPKPRDIKDQFLDVIGTLAATGEPFSANDCRHLLPELPATRVGALWNAAVRRYALREVGRVPDPYGHRIPVWKAAA